MTGTTINILYHLENSSLVASDPTSSFNHSSEYHTYDQLVLLSGFVNWQNG